MKNVQSAILTEACQLRRMAWIDNAKTIGIGLMIVDHFLIYFGNESHWSRYTITRLAEPLLILSLFHVLITRSRGISMKRWLQIAIAAVIETALHTHREGHLYFGILSSLVVTAPLVVRIARAKSQTIQALVVASFSFSLVAIESSPITIDYGPVVSENSITAEIAEDQGVGI